MGLAKILAKANIGAGSKVAVMPSFYGFDSIGNALRELEAKGVFVDLDKRRLEDIKLKFPEFETVNEDVIKFAGAEIAAVIHYRPMFEYPFEAIKIAPESVIYREGFEKMVGNIRRLSSNFVLISTHDPKSINEELNSLSKFGFRVVEQGPYKDKSVERYLIGRA